MRGWLLLSAALGLALGQVLTPSQITISHKKPIVATSTCGEINGSPIREVFCTLAGSNQYSPYSQYSYQDDVTANNNMVQEMRNPREAMFLGGHGCGHCEADSADAHPASFMVDGNTSWWQSPPLSRGMQYNEVNITIDLEQEFHVAYVWIQMANTPKPSTWILERSTDFGKTFKPWYYFAVNPAECMRRFGMESLAPITEDESVICRSDMASIQPLDNAEMVINLLEHRPSRLSFASSEALQNFTRATNVRLRLLGTRTLQGHLMDLNDKTDPTVTRRYFYAIKEILMGGRCVCNGHAATCDILDPKRPRALLCRCEHNTCGDMCESCCPGFEQKKWQATTAHNNFTCEPCNCFGRSNECVYEEELALQNKSLDIHGNYEGGGRCLNCRDYTEGINCNKCVFGFYKPEGVQWDDAMPCKPCQCNPDKHTGSCRDGDGKCECQARFEGENCDQCAKGYYDAPECKKCECMVDGTEGEICLPVEDQCPCKAGYGGTFCETCASGFTNVTAGCPECTCHEMGSENATCSAETGQCVCKSAFAGLSCDKCQKGYFGFPTCTYCNCDPMGTEDGQCDSESGQCLCKPGFVGEKCDQCDTGFYGYPHCKKCECDAAGSESPECDSSSGQCPCYGNFTARTCDKCAAGFYGYPNCKACSCLIEGAKGLTCDSEGQCYCKGNFEGERCDKCKQNFYNFPNCEECNCNPNGVTPDFAGCDKVAPGELCSCRAHVTGRICDQCKPTFWDLQYHHTDGCVGCDCNLPGTLSMLNTCQIKSGQCECKRNAGGRRCDQCADGYFNLQSYNQMGCEACNCDIGGALRRDCDVTSGQCRCRPRVMGLHCDKPIENHYFPTLWHNQYEAEDGHTADNRPVRFAVDAGKFPEFSWRGYAVFSPIQEEGIIDMDIAKSSVYRLLFKYHNPTTVPITAEVTVDPRTPSTHDQKQSEKVVFAPSDMPSIKEITVNGKPFVMNPGRWNLNVVTKQRLFLDYVVVLPVEYYEGSSLTERESSPCLAHSLPNSTCVDLLYPPMPTAVRADVYDEKKTFKYVNIDGTTTDLGLVPIEILPEIIGPAAYVRADNNSKVIEAVFDVPSDDEYAVVLEYHNLEKTAQGVIVDVAQEGETRLNGTVIINHCPYATFCRVLVSEAGTVPFVPLKQGQATVQLIVDPMHEFGLAAVNLVRKKDWNTEYLKQVPVCVRKNGKCLPQAYPPAANSIVAEVETGANQENALSGEKLAFPIAHAAEVVVVPLDETLGTLEVAGIVPTRGHYMFLVHYFNPDNTALELSVLLQYHEHFSEATVPLAYCPSVSGCRALIKDKERPEVIQYFIEEKYTASFYHNDSQKGPIYINSITAVPYHSFSESLMSPLPIDISTEFVEKCSENFFHNEPTNVTEFCRQKIFSLTTDFNSAALSCDCNAKGSESFCCAEYGGQCKCKANIIGRRCDRCAPGYYNYPECIPCKCGANQQCEERTGQCFCPPHVEGTTCDKCVGYAFGYDPLIGCQQCGCHPQGSEGGSLQCDAESGQCLCRESAGGRQCDRCLAGFYGFPHCYACRCNTAGTTEKICDGTTAQCQCKENVMGSGCDTCKPGTFDLAAANPLGCADCFCFGITDQCRSSMFPVSISSLDLSAFTSTDQSGTTALEDDVITYTSSNETKESVYFVAPINHGSDYTTSYGLMLSVKLSVSPSEDHSSMSSEADIRLHGNNLTAEYWSPEQPADPQQMFSVRARLVPENFISSTGRPLTREDMMMVLQSLDNITIKASYYHHPKSAKLFEFAMEVSSSENAFDSVLRAASVEQCLCPAPYAGPSCQQCAVGYYRVEGNFLGACVPCDCNGHSGTCDATTGVCSDCEDNTHGDHCELCDEGHFGDATTGNPYSCMACQCPYPPDNNFATSCQVSEYGELQSCACKPGYTGERCDRCDAGFFGEPNRPGGSCQPCDCNGNNNLTDSRACHPLSGDCYMCDGNTAGRHCEWCAPWFHGDAVVAKNCESCACDQCGATRCDNTEGNCECKQNVEGQNCDRCKEDHWGFSRCRGCDACHCGVAASSGQCHAETGQCACRPGASGQRCEHCEHGFWNYGEHGCHKCDCEADLSMGTVCDVRTGQCHCQEGATGARCDQCEKSYLRIPTLGCRRCDECVHHLMVDTDDLSLELDLLNTSISNISSATVVGARLSRSKKTLTKYTELSDLLSNKDSQYDNFIGDAKNALTAKAVLFNTANRTFSVVSKDTVRAMNLTMDAQKVLQQIRDNAEYSRTVIYSVSYLASSLGSHSSALNVDPQLLRDAEDVLHQLEAATADGRPKQAELVPAFIEELNKKLGDVTFKLQVQKERLENEQKKTESVADYLADAQKLLKESKKQSDATIQASRSQSLFTLEGLSKAISDDVTQLSEQKKTVSDILLEVNNKTESTRDHRESIDSQLATLAEIRAEVAESVESRREKRDAAVDVDSVKAKATELTQQAERLNGTFGSARLESQTAVEAASAYSNVTSSLESAKEHSQKAIDVITEEKESIDNMKSSVSSTLEISASQAQNATELQENALKSLLLEAGETEKEIDALTEQMDAMRRARTLLHDGMTSPLEESTIEDIQAKVDQVNALKTDMEKALEETRSQIAETKEKSDDVISTRMEAVQGVKTARSNIKELGTLAPAIATSFEKMKSAAAARTTKVDVCGEKIVNIKEMIAVARDAANRIRLGAHFARGSSLDLNMPLRVARSAAHTDLSFHFRTAADHGIPLFFGNEEGMAGTRAVPTDDYIAVEVEYGQPKVTIDLGDAPLVVKLNTKVSDNEWRRIDVERIGKSATVSISKPNSDEIEERQTNVSTGNKSVLNLHQTMSKLFVGGIPQDGKIAKEVRNRDFEGDIEELLLHGEPVGLWNAKKGGMVNVQGAPKRPRNGDSVENPGVSLNGDGYIVHELGHWNPRKKTVFSLEFLTYSPEGLLFFVGKERDFLALELSLGSVRLTLDFGSGVGQWASETTNYNDGQWHTVTVMREGTHIKMDVDGETVAEGDSPGDKAEMSVTDKFYLGGTPTGVNTRSPSEPLRGCLKNIQLNSDTVDLQGRGVRASKGVRNACPVGSVRTVSILSDRSSAVFSNVTAKDEMEVTLRFKTRQAAGVVLSIKTEDEDLLQLAIQDTELLVLASDDKLDIELASAADEQWHFISVKKNKDLLRIDVDDLYSKEVKRNNGEDVHVGETASIVFGRHEAGSFVGCVGDVTVNGKLLDFSKAEIKEVSLTGCSLRDDIVRTTLAPTTSSSQTKEEVVTVAPATTEEPTTPAPEVRPEGACALPRSPRGALEDSEGTRFGLTPNSRFEYGVTPDSYDKSGTFSMVVRATADSGVLMFATNEKHTDHIGLFVSNGRVVFSYDTGSGPISLRSNQSILDGAWHSIKASRHGNEGHLVVDDESVEISVEHGTESIDTQAPLYIGGVPSELAAYTRQIVPGVNAEFGGCMRDLKLNEKEFQGTAKEYNTVPCSVFVENGLYFGENGGYAILKKDYHVGKTFSAEMEIRPRVNNAVLFSVGKVEYLTVQILNGTVKFTVDSGAGQESLIHEPDTSNAFCDGHWHSIKIMKKKNLMTLTVDGKSNLLIMKKSKKPETVTNDPIYLAGLPAGAEKPKGLETSENYVGCIRIASYGNRRSRVIRKKKQLDFSKMEVFGDVNRDECPLN